MLMLRLWFFGGRMKWHGTRHSRTLAKVVEFRRRTRSRTLVVVEPALRDEHFVFTRHLTTTGLCWLEGCSSCSRFSPGRRGVVLKVPRGGRGRPERGRVPARCRGGRRRSHLDSSGSRDDPPPLARTSAGLSSTSCPPPRWLTTSSLFPQGASLLLRAGDGGGCQRAETLLAVHVLQPELHSHSTGSGTQKPEKPPLRDTKHYFVDTIWSLRRQSWADSGGTAMPGQPVAEEGRAPPTPPIPENQINILTSLWGVYQILSW